MSKRVMTAHGPGVVVATDDIRGRVQYQVEGDGFKVWVSAASVAEFGQVEWENDTDKVDETNSTTLPYNPTPQFLPHGGESTIQPTHKIDIDKRTSPSDSLRFSSVQDLQARLGNKYAAIPEDVDYGSLQARLDEDPYRLLSDFRQRAFETRAGLDPSLGQQMDLEAMDKGLRTAAWADVRKKAVRLRRTGMVDMEAANPSAIVAMVTGDHGIYETIVIRGSVFTGSSAITEWSCSCPWGDWAFERQHTFVGRLCSHAYASLLELQALNKRKEKPEGWRNTASVHTAADWSSIGGGSNTFAEVDGYSLVVMKGGNTMYTWMVLDPSDNEVASGKERSMGAAQESATSAVAGRTASVRTAADGAKAVVMNSNFGKVVTVTDGDQEMSWGVDAGPFTTDEDVTEEVVRAELAKHGYEDIPIIWSMGFYGARTAADLGSMSDQELLDHYDSFPEHVDTDQSDEFIKVEDEVERRGLIDAMIEAARHPREDGKLSTEPGTLGFDERHIPYRRDKARTDVTAGNVTAAGHFDVEIEENTTFAGQTEYFVYCDGSLVFETRRSGVTALSTAEMIADKYRNATEYSELDGAIYVANANDVTAFLDEPTQGFGGTGQRDYIGTSAEELAGESYEDIDGPDFNPVMQNADDVVVAHVPDNEAGTLVDVMDPEDTVEAAFDEDGLTEDEVVARFQRSAGHIMSEGSSGGGDHDIASAALAHLRTAGRTFTMAEQQALIDEEPVGGPVDRSGLDLSGTHYLS